MVYAFVVSCPGLRQVHTVGSASKNMVSPMLREGLDKMHGASHEGASPAKLLCQVVTNTFIDNLMITMC